MLKKKFFAKALAFAMVTGLMATAAPIGAAAPVVQVLADEGDGDGDSDSEEGEIDPDALVEGKVVYENYTLTITPKTGDNYVFIEVLKKKDDTKPGTTYAYPCTGKEAVEVDLSFLKAAKDSYLKVWGDQHLTKVAVDIIAQPKKLKLKYKAAEFPANPDETTLKTYRAGSFDGLDASISYNVKSLYGYDWDDLDNYLEEGKLETAKVAGTTLLIREAAVETSGTTKGQPAGAEVKVKIPASPKAPKVTIDYTKGSIKLPKSSQYGIFVGNELKYVDCSGGALTLEKILEEVAGKNYTDAEEKKTFVNNSLKDGFNLVVRTSSTKGTSVPAFVTVKATPQIDGETEGKIMQGTQALATYTYDDQGVTLSANGFEYKDGDKWKKLSSGKLFKTTNATLTIRLAGVKDKDEKKAQLPSNEITIKKAEDKSGITIKLGSDVVTTASVAKDATITLTVEVKDKKGEVVSSPTVTWSSSAATAEVAGGVVAGKAAGTATITAKVTIDGVEKTATVIVTVTDDAP